MSWTPGDVSGSQTLTDSDHLYPDHVNELRQAIDKTPINVLDYAGTITGTGTNADPYISSDGNFGINDAIETNGSGKSYFLPDGYYQLTSDILIADTYDLLNAELDIKGKLITPGYSFVVGSSTNLCYWCNFKINEIDGVNQSDVGIYWQGGKFSQLQVTRIARCKKGIHIKPAIVNCTDNTMRFSNIEFNLEEGIYLEGVDANLIAQGWSFEGGFVDYNNIGLRTSVNAELTRFWGNFDFNTTYDIQDDGGYGCYIYPFCQSTKVVGNLLQTSTLISSLGPSNFYGEYHQITGNKDTTKFIGKGTAYEKHIFYMGATTGDLGAVVVRNNTADDTTSMQFQSDGDITMFIAGKGLVVKSPNGSVTRRIGIDNSGNLSIGTV